nr:hypothetical protein [Nitrospirota bacterium]
MARVVGAAASPQPLSPLLVALEQLPERAPVSHAPPAPPTSTKAEDHLAYLEDLLAEAARLRAQALSQLTDEERQFLFDHAARLAEGFVPQWSEQDETERRQAQADRRFFALVGEKLDQASLLAAAQLLANLDDEKWLDRVRVAF